ncbi:hypothetical protein [Streptomyces sp. DH12]|nr:hypothetical protein [Streptomyces sp. DH12]
MGAQAPECCGRTMRRDGRQFVCSKCKGWLDSALTARVAVLAQGVR